jgi:hypothetical protein
MVKWDIVIIIIIKMRLGKGIISIYTIRGCGWKSKKKMINETVV